MSDFYQLYLVQIKATTIYLDYIFIFGWQSLDEKDVNIYGRSILYLCLADDLVFLSEDITDL